MKLMIIPILMTLALISIIPNVYAQIDAELIEQYDSIIDASAENPGDRLLLAYFEITDFDISKYDHFDVITIDDTDNIILTQQVQVSSSVTGLIDFGSMVGYLIPLNSQTGNYHLEISIDGISFNTVNFSVI